ncbi:MULTISPECIES: EAL domain-containing protein [unclassified Aliivibrio]|uniref:EAL domain-containing protein n=1 Tax=unclassified Aliivibrio TaxID=2645654 RepID=UPI0009F6BEE8
MEPILSAISLARNQNALIVIEGVETAKQYEDMKLLGIDYFQGFLLGKPLPLQQQNHQAA